MDTYVRSPITKKWNRAPTISFAAIASSPCCMMDLCMNSASPSPSLRTAYQPLDLLPVGVYQPTTVTPIQMLTKLLCAMSAIREVDISLAKLPSIGLNPSSRRLPLCFFYLLPIPAKSHTSAGSLAQDVVLQAGTPQADHSGSYRDRLSR